MTPPFRIVAGAHNVPLVQAVTNAVLREASFKEPHVLGKIVFETLKHFVLR